MQRAATQTALGVSSGYASRLSAKAAAKVERPEQIAHKASFHLQTSTKTKLLMMNENLDPTSQHLKLQGAAKATQHVRSRSPPNPREAQMHELNPMNNLIDSCRGS